MDKHLEELVYEAIAMMGTIYYKTRATSSYENRKLILDIHANLTKLLNNLSPRGWDKV
jgi:hypothetical protein